MKIKDQTGKIMNLPAFPKRIISLVPSITELLFDLELDERIAGVTKFCVHPSEKIRKKPQIGGTKKVDLEKIVNIKPDLIIANMEENTKTDVEALMDKYPVWVSNVISLEEAHSLIDSIGQMTNRTELAAKMNSEIQLNFAGIEKLPSLKVAYLIWKNPFMAAGKNTFINTLINQTGLINIISEERYPEVDLKNIEADLILLSTEPYPFAEKHILELKKEFPHHKFLLIDGEMFSWYGSRLRMFPAYVNSISSAVSSSQK